MFTTSNSSNFSDPDILLYHPDQDLTYNSEKEGLDDSIYLSPTLEIWTGNRDRGTLTKIQ